MLFWAGALVQWLWDETGKLKVVCSNPSTAHWIDIIHIFFLKIALMFV